ncbi:MAG TPA: YggT family protein [Acidimicrobiia bacterium]|nr:YggT family protein [Acidimicrobiia bacterium]
MGQLLCSFITVYFVVLFARIILSWFPVEPGSAMAGIYRILYDLTEPVLAPVRGLIPPIGGSGMAFDLSPIIVFVGLTIVQRFVC